MHSKALLRHKCTKRPLGTRNSVTYGLLHIMSCPSLLDIDSGLIARVRLIEILPHLRQISVLLSTLQMHGLIYYVFFTGAHGEKIIIAMIS